MERFHSLLWGIVIVPANTLEAASGTFGGRRWNDWCTRRSRKPRSEAVRLFCESDFPLPAPLLKLALLHISALRPTKPLFDEKNRPTCPAFCDYRPSRLCLILSFAAAKPFAKYLSNWDVVAAIPFGCGGPSIGKLFSAPWPARRQLKRLYGYAIVAATSSTP